MFRVMPVCAALAVSALLCGSAEATPFSFTTGAPDGRMGLASRPASPFRFEVEAADDFILAGQTTIQSATFTGLLPSGLPLSSIEAVGVEIYRVFPNDSVSPPSGQVPTRVNSPSDNAFDGRGSLAGNLTFLPSLLSPTFTVANSIVNGINPIPSQTTGGEGAVTGEEVRFDLTFTTPFDLPADHYFFVPQVQLPGVMTFLWLSTARSGPLFPGDLQAWIRNEPLTPDWLRAGTDIVGGTAPPTFNEAFSLAGDAPSPLTVPEPTSLLLVATGITAGIRRWRHHRRTSYVTQDQSPAHQ